MVRILHICNTEELLKKEVKVTQDRLLESKQRVSWNEKAKTITQFDLANPDKAVCQYKFATYEDAPKALHGFKATKVVISELLPRDDVALNLLMKDRNVIRIMGEKDAF